MIVTHKKRRFHGLLAGVLAAALVLPSLGYGASSGSFDDEDMAPPKKVVKPKPVFTPDDKKSEGTLQCPDGGCKSGLHKDDTIKPIYPRSNSSSEREECYRLHLLNVAKSAVASKPYYNRDHSKGACAAAVRRFMSAAGMNPLGGLGDAYHWKRDGKLKQLGFKDIYYQGMQPWQAPPGAILIFRGPMTLATNAYLPRRKDRNGMGAGNWVGHVTIKGDNGFYYTDGRTEDPAVRNRFLAGVYVPDTGAMFSPWVKRKCGDL